MILDNNNAFKENNEGELRKRLIVELNGLMHNLQNDSLKYYMTLYVMYEAKRTEIRLADLFNKYADCFVYIGVSVLDILI